MNKILLTTALVALTALSACKKDDVASTEPAAGDETTMSAPADESSSMVAPATTEEAAPATTEAPADADASATPAEPAVAPEGTTAEGIAVGEPNPATPAADANSCGDHASLVGKNVSEIDTAALGKDVRVIKPGDAVTMDFNAERINIEVDANGVVTSVRCG